ncbi:MAG: hypothetical protein ACOC5I_00535 [Gemmatimonadota bacterium]
MNGQNSSYAMKRTLELDYDEVDRRVRDALRRLRAWSRWQKKCGPDW